MSRTYLHHLNQQKSRIFCIQYRYDLLQEYFPLNITWGKWLNIKEKTFSKISLVIVWPSKTRQNIVPMPHVLGAISTRGPSLTTYPRLRVCCRAQVRYAGFIFWSENESSPLPSRKLYFSHSRDNKIFTRHTLF